MSQSQAIVNARIWTADPVQPWAGSIAWTGNRIDSVGDDVANIDHCIVDMEQRVILPGLIDAHMHLLLGARSLAELDLSAVRTRTDFESAIATRHRTLAPGTWLVAHSWSNESWADKTLPDKTWLRAAGDRPVVCYRMDQHAALVNDAVLSQCDLNVDLRGGRIEREPATGEPTGLMIEAALWELVNPLRPAPTAADDRAAILVAMRQLNCFGVTTVGTMEYEQNVMDSFMPMRTDLSVRCGVTLLDRKWPMQFDFGTGFPSDSLLWIVGYKAFIDGTLGSRTARMLNDYADDPGNRGMLLELADDGHLGDWIQAVARAGLSPSMHAIGDAAARLALDAADLVGDQVPVRIEHAQQVDPADIARCADRFASMQPLHKADDGCYAEARVGGDRLVGTFAFRKLRDAGARLAFGSDWPIVSCDPMRGIRTAVTGLTNHGSVFLPEQNLTVEEALIAYTREAAACLGRSDIGCLRAGGCADMIALDRDPFEADWSANPPRVVMTIQNGTIVYDDR